jgi:adenylate cyclase
MLITCYNATGNSQAVLRVAQIALARTEKVLAQDRNNGIAIGHGSVALAMLGQAERAKEWMDRAMLIDPENWNMRYNFACALAAYLRESDAALDMLGPVFANMSTGLLMHAKVDPDFDLIRDHARFKAMIAAAEARLALAEDAPPASA